DALSGAAGLFIGGVPGHVAGQARQRVAAAAQPLVARTEHVQRLVKTGGGGVETRKRLSHGESLVVMARAGPVVSGPRNGRTACRQRDGSALRSAQDAAHDAFVAAEMVPERRDDVARDRGKQYPAQQTVKVSA